MSVYLYIYIVYIAKTLAAYQVARKVWGTYGHKGPTNSVNSAN